MSSETGVVVSDDVYRRVCDSVVSAQKTVYSGADSAMADAYWDTYGAIFETVGERGDE